MRVGGLKKWSPAKRPAVAQRLGDLRDRQGAGVGGEDRLRPGQRLDGAEQRLLGGEVFDDRLDDEVGRGDLGERRCGDPVADRVGTAPSSRPFATSRRSPSPMAAMARRDGARPPRRKGGRQSRSAPQARRCRGPWHRRRRRRWSRRRSFPGEPRRPFFEERGQALDTVGGAENPLTKAFFSSASASASGNVSPSRATRLISASATRRQCGDALCHRQGARRKVGRVANFGDEAPAPPPSRP